MNPRKLSDRRLSMRSLLTPMRKQKLEGKSKRHDRSRSEI
jgi:hypothetical protein